MGRRGDEVDPVLTEHVKERLAQLLEENRPRRAQTGGGSASRSVRAGSSSPEVGHRGLRRGPDPEPEPEVLYAGPGSAGESAGPARGGRAAWSDVGGGAAAHSYEDSSADSYADSSADGAFDEPPHRRRVFGRVHVGVVAALLLVAVLWAGWAVLRARPVALAASPASVGSSAEPSVASSGASAAASPSPTGAAASGSASASTSAPTIEVHVLGAVRRPGVVSLRGGLRVDDAIKAAGGLARDAAPGELNLAQVLQDGQQVVIGTKAEPAGEVRDGSAGAVPSTASSGATGSADVVDLNAATEAQLEELPGVGPVTAGKILAWRQEHGRFSRVEELQEIDGIGPKTYAQIAPHARV